MGIVIKNFVVPNIKEGDEEKFVSELEDLCRKYVGNDFIFDWETE